MEPGALVARLSEGGDAKRYVGSGQLQVHRPDKGLMRKGHFSPEGMLEFVGDQAESSMCLYDLSGLGGAALARIVGTHNKVLLGGTLLDNPNHGG